MIKVIGISVAALFIIYKFLGNTGLILIACIFAVLLALIYFNQNKILYMPVIPQTTLSPSGNSFGYKHPSDKGLQTQDVQITTSDNFKLKGWFLKSDNSQRIIIYFHQNAGNIGFRIPFIKEITQRTNSDVLLVAYRGFSDSQGSPTEEGLQRDAEAVLDWTINYKNKLLAQGVNKNIYVFGRSLGGAVTIYISTHKAYQKQISGVILQNTFTSISDMIDSIFPFLTHFKFLQRNYWKSVELIPTLELPALFIRSMLDEIVPTQQMAILIEKATNCKIKQEHRIKRGTHNSSWDLDPDTYFQKYMDFFDQVENKQI